MDYRQRTRRSFFCFWKHQRDNIWGIQDQRKEQRLCKDHLRGRRLGLQGIHRDERKTTVPRQRRHKHYCGFPRLLKETKPCNTHTHTHTHTQTPKHTQTKLTIFRFFCFYVQEPPTYGMPYDVNQK